MDNLLEHKPALMAYAMRSVKDYDIANDLVSQTFYRVIRAENPNKNQNIGGYLMATLKNIILDYFRKITRENINPLLNTSDSATFTDNFVDEPAVYDSYDYGTTFENDRVQEVYETLPEYQQQVLHMSVKLKMSDSEIAQELGIALNTVSTRRMRATKAMKEILNPDK